MIVNRTELLQRLETIQPGLSVKDIVEQSSSFIFRDGIILTYNDEVACRIKSPLEDFTGAVRAKPLLDILRKLPEDEITVASKNGEFVITGKNKKAGIKMDDEITIPVDTVETPKEADWKEIAEEFLEALSLVQECVSKDAEKFILTCIHIHPKWLEACDTFQISRYTMNTGVANSTLVKKDSIKHIISLGITMFAQTPRWMHFKNSTGLVYSCKRFEEQYPNLSTAMVMDGAERATLPKGLVEAADKAGVFSGENQDNDQVLVDLKENKLRITGQGTSGWYKEVRDMVYEGPDISFTISPKLLQEIAKKYSDCHITKNKLKVDGGKFCYYTVLGDHDGD